MKPSSTIIELSHAHDASAVERFAREHSATHRSQDGASQGTYHTLIPTQLPEQGEQYAFQVNLDKCSACKSCVSACHHMNGLSEEESWRRVSQWSGEKQGDNWIQTVTSACHHCVDPECMNGCPVGAYEKHPITGIVKHLDDQCIGCEYCIWKCPYEVPRYNESFGIVRKCDMCSERITHQVEPACVQACPHDAIQIGIAKEEELVHPGKIRGMLPNALYPGAPDSKITLPSSRYQTKRSQRNVQWNRIDSGAEKNKPHWPLVWMLTLTQWGVGILTAHFIQWSQFAGVDRTSYGPAFWLGTLLVIGGLIASTFHLGHPAKAWRFFLGLKKSWLSREILLFSLLGGCLTLAGADAFLNILPLHTKTQLGTTVVLTGWAGVFSSVMIYHDTHRPAWALHRTGSQFLESVLGGVLTFCAWGSFSGDLIVLNSSFTLSCLMLFLLVGSKVTRWRRAGNTQDRDKTILRMITWILLPVLITCFAWGLAIERTTLATGVLVSTISVLFLLDLNGRVQFFRQGQPPVASTSTQERHA